ncbi:MAG: type II toxin-antitoxin system RelE/ParE family toxin [Ignavibacteriaceae bacterium]|nr:type II toxin-antitoxin system RelE/ParE family toxin [Ignavibacteriaceae bacterium]
MHISYKDKKLGQSANNSKLLKKNYGMLADKLKQRLDQLFKAESLEELRNAPGNFHELKQNRKGQWACNLNANHRLIFTPQESPIPIDDTGSFNWSEIRGIEIIEIIDYHGE